MPTFNLNPDYDRRVGETFEEWLQRTSVFIRPKATPAKTFSEADAIRAHAIGVSL